LQPYLTIILQEIIEKILKKNIPIFEKTKTMTRIIFDIDNSATEEFVKQFAMRMNIPFHETKVVESTNTENQSLLETLRSMSIPASESSFGDASEFQREIRKDRKLPYRK
jgi:hypothetical protein